MTHLVRRTIETLLVMLVISCGVCTEVKENYLDPPKPPEGIKILVLSDPVYTGDYLLVFSSENRGNTRFGGFLAFVSDTRDGVMDIDNASMAKFRLEGSSFNLGIDKPVAVLFTGNATIPTELAGYEIASSLPKTTLTAYSGKWLTMRTYLIDDNSNIIELSTPGNPVQIP